MIYTGCRYLLRYGYLSNSQNCEVCALESDNIHTEEHHEARTRYLERTRWARDNFLEEDQGLPRESNRILVPQEARAPHLANTDRSPLMVVEREGTPVGRNLNQSLFPEVAGVGGCEWSSTEDLSTMEESHRTYDDQSSEYGSEVESKQQISSKASDSRDDRAILGNRNPEEEASSSLLPLRSYRSVLSMINKTSEPESESESRQRRRARSATVPGASLPRNNSTVDDDNPNSNVAQESPHRYHSTTDLEFDSSDPFAAAAARGRLSALMGSTSVYKEALEFPSEQPRSMDFNGARKEGVPVGNDLIPGSFGNVMPPDLAEALRVGMQLSKMLMASLNSGLASQAPEMNNLTYMGAGLPAGTSWMHSQSPLAIPTFQGSFTIPSDTIQFNPLSVLSDGSPSHAIHRQVFHPGAQLGIPEAVAGTSVSRQVNQLTNTIPNDPDWLNRSANIPISRSKQPGRSTRRLPKQKKVSSRKVPEASLQSDTSISSAGRLSVSTQHRAVAEQGSNRSPQYNRRTTVPSNRQQSVIEKASDGVPSSIANYHSSLDSSNLLVPSSSSSKSPDNYLVGRKEQVMLEHLYAKPQPIAAGVSNSRTKLGSSSGVGFGGQDESHTTSKEIGSQGVLTKADTRELYFPGISNPIPNPTTGLTQHPMLREGFAPSSCLSGDPSIPSRQAPNVTQTSRKNNAPNKSSLSAKRKRSWPSAQPECCNEIATSPLVKKLRTSGKRTPISNNRKASRRISTKFTASSSSTISEQPQSVVGTRMIENGYRQPATNMDLTTMPVIEDVNSASTKTTDNSKTVVPWSAAPFSLSHGLYLDLPLQPFGSIGGHLQSRGINEYWGTANSSSHDMVASDEDIKYLVEWLMHSATTAEEELPSPHPSLLSITSGESGEATGVTPKIISSKDSRNSASPVPMSNTNRDSADLIGSAPTDMQMGNSKELIEPETMSISSEGLGEPLSSNPEDTNPIEELDKGDVELSSQEDSELQNCATNSNNSRKSSIPRKNHSENLKLSIRGKVAKSPSLSSEKTSKHFIIVCGGEAFRINSRVLEEASPVVRDFSKTCLQTSSTGDCVFEIVGVTPWAMYELLSYICCSSYNPVIIHSAYIKRLAEKLKIDLTSHKYNYGASLLPDLSDAYKFGKFKKKL